MEGRVLIGIPTQQQRVPPLSMVHTPHIDSRHLDSLIVRFLRFPILSPLFNLIWFHNFTITPMVGAGRGVRVDRIIIIRRIYHLIFKMKLLIIVHPRVDL
jgi:hypothetical protein